MGGHRSLEKMSLGARLNLRRCSLWLTAVDSNKKIKIIITTKACLERMAYTKPYAKQLSLLFVTTNYAEFWFDPFYTNDCLTLSLLQVRYKCADQRTCTAPETYR
jgi:hypothetical protein